MESADFLIRVRFCNGFDRDGLKGLLAAAGFTDINDVTAHTIYTPVESGAERAFPVFLNTAIR